MKKCVLGFLALTMFGCGDGSGSEGSSFTDTTGGAGGQPADTGTNAGGSGGTGGDAPQVTVVVIDQTGAPMANVPVLVNDAEGAVVAETKTDADGKAIAAVPEGGSVSAFHAQQKSFAVRSVVAPPAPGNVAFQFDVLQDVQVDLTKVTTYKIVATGYPLEASKIVATLNGACASGTAAPGQPLKLDDHACPGKSAHKLLVAAYDSNHDIVGWAQQDVELAPGGTVNVAPSTDSPTIYGVSVEIDHLPQPASMVTVGAFVADGTMVFGNMATQQPYNAPSFEASTVLPHFGGYNVCVHGSAAITDGEAGSQTGGRLCESPPGQSWCFDAAQARWVYVTDLDTTDSAHPRMTWSTTPGKTADMIALSLSWSVGAAWVDSRVLLPPDHATAWRLGDLPEDLLSFGPTAASDYGTVSLRYSAVDGIAGYADAVDGLELGQDSTTAEWAYSWLKPVSLQ